MELKRGTGSAERVDTGRMQSSRRDRLEPVAKPWPLRSGGAWASPNPCPGVGRDGTFFEYSREALAPAAESQRGQDRWG